MILLSHWINHKTPCYGGRRESLSLNVLSDICSGALSNSLELHMNNHVGTHMDFPRHFDPRGKTLSDYSPDDLMFSAPCLVELTLKSEDMIAKADLDGKITPEADFILIRTGFEAKREQEIYWKNNPGFLPEVGFWLRNQFPTVRGVGFDFISLTCFQKRELGREAHRAFLNPYKNLEPVLIVEDMKLSPLLEAPKRLVLAPLLIERADGAPVSVLAEP